MKVKDNPPPVWVVVCDVSLSLVCVCKDEPDIGRSLCQLRGGACFILGWGRLRLRGRRDSSMSVPVGTRKMVNYA